ncbi:MAG: hydantoinase/oxoprolinase N-terminal domain-containing protein, partial [Myxococcota bacterium]
MKPGWKIWIDRGGTFTDVIAQRPDGSLAKLKVLSADPERYGDPVREGIQRVLAGEPGQVDLESIEVVRIGTTIATNALLEGKGEPTVLVTTKGFGDALWIGYQARPKIFELNIRRPAPLYARVIEVKERLAADGSVSVPLAEAELEDDLRAARDVGLKSAAIVFLHSYRNPAHEERAASIARSVGFEYVAISSEVSPLIRFVSRGQPAVAAPHLTPLIRRYFHQLDEDVHAPLFFMQSNGGLVAGDRVLGKDVVYSGPAGGVVGMARAGEREGFDRLIGFDMGGTSTDVSVYDGAFERRDETIVRDLRLRAPSLEVNSVASGGGSILSFDGMRLRVGDDSAGADPGPP